jgi:hypothetical protein
MTAGKLPVLSLPEQQLVKKVVKQMKEELLAQLHPGDVQSLCL